MRTLAVLLLLLAVAACERKSEAQMPPPGPPPPPAPFTFTSKSPAAEVSLTLPQNLAAHPVLHHRLYASGKRQLTDFMAMAARDRARAEQKGADRPPAAVYERTSAWRIAAQTSRLISLIEDWHVYSGGAHPNHGTTVMLWDKASDVEVRQSALFRRDVDYVALDRVLCEAVRKAKVARLGVKALEGEFWTCPQWKYARAAMTPSTIPGKFGGLTFLFDPYVIGAYAEGDYAVTIPQESFRSAVLPSYQPQFAGAPAAAPAKAAPAP